ncbi:MAG: hypothetical protein LBF15_00455 [Candidatus Peribacteria bacterium]|nr:hypothetical protein [Candidatus Peribacteria bacterium]
MIVLQKAFEDYKDKRAFSFEITKVGNRIRFFIVTPKKYSSYLQNQIYAHFNSVEIIEVADYLAKIPNNKLQV